MASALNSLGALAYWLFGRLPGGASKDDGGTPPVVGVSAAVAGTYDDGGIRCDEQALTIRNYYPWGVKGVPYTSIRGIERLPLTGANTIRKWRLWGSGDFRHWWSLDVRRPGKSMALVIDVGRRVSPTVTPRDPDAVQGIITEHLSGSQGAALTRAPRFQGPGQLGS